MNREASPSSKSGDPDDILVPIYSSANQPEVEIITDILEAEDVAYMIRSRQMAAFPTTIGEHDQIRILVVPAAIERAQALIEQALEDEAIPGDGNFINNRQRAKIEKGKKKAKKKAAKAEKQAEKDRKKAQKAEKKAKKAEKKAKKEAKKAEKQAKKAAKQRKRAEKKRKKADRGKD